MNSHWGLILNVKHLLKQLDYLVSFSHWIFLYAIIANNNLINWTRVCAHLPRHTCDHDYYFISNVTLFLLVLFHCHVSDTSFLKFRRRYQPRGTGRVVLLRLPPIMIVLADDLQDVAGFERDSGLGARYQLVLQRIIVKLCSNEYLSVQKDRNINIFRRVPEREKFVSIGCCIGDPIWDRWNDIERFFYKYRWNVMCKRCAGSRVRVKLEKIGD